jgi:hypothetical protein
MEVEADSKPHSAAGNSEERSAVEHRVLVPEQHFGAHPADYQIKLLGHKQFMLPEAHLPHHQEQI